MKMLICNVYNNRLVTSGWRDVDQTMPRSEGKLKILEELFTQVKQLRPADAPVIKGWFALLHSL